MRLHSDDRNRVKETWCSSPREKIYTAATTLNRAEQRSCNHDRLKGKRSSSNIDISKEEDVKMLMMMVISFSGSNSNHAKLKKTMGLK